MSADLTQNGLIFAFTGKEGSNLITAQEGFYNQIASEIVSLEAQVIFTDGLQAELENEISSAGKSLEEGNLYIFQIQNGEINFLEVKEGLDSSVNWADAARIFAINYQNLESEDGRYKWGQKVPQTGEYLCVDCGYILELEAGKTFPICEVCLSGCPEGPSGAEGAFWEMV